MPGGTHARRIRKCPGRVAPAVMPGGSSGTAGRANQRVDARWAVRQCGPGERERNPGWPVRRQCQSRWRPGLHPRRRLRKPQANPSDRSASASRTSPDPRGRVHGRYRWPSHAERRAGNEVGNRDADRSGLEGSGDFHGPVPVAGPDRPGESERSLSFANAMASRLRGVRDHPRYGPKTSSRARRSTSFVGVHGPDLEPSRRATSFCTRVRRSDIAQHLRSSRWLR